LTGASARSSRRLEEGRRASFLPAKEILFCSQFVWYLDVLGSVALSQVNQLHSLCVVLGGLGCRRIRWNAIWRAKSAADFLVICKCIIYNNLRAASRFGRGMKSKLFSPVQTCSKTGVFGVKTRARWREKVEQLKAASRHDRERQMRHSET
jgi:hypothetical protein